MYEKNGFGTHVPEPFFVLSAAADAADLGCSDLRRQAAGGSAAVADAGAVARAEAAGALRVHKDLLAGAAVAHEQRAVQHSEHGCANGHGITSVCGLTPAYAAGDGEVRQNKNPCPRMRTGMKYGADDGSRTHQKHRLYALSDGVVLHFVLHASKKNLSLFWIASFFASLRVC